MAQPLIALAGCEDAVYLVEIGHSAEKDAVSARQEGGVVERSHPLELAPPWAAGKVIDVTSNGSTVAVLPDRKPPLVFSHDGGVTWQERGAGLPTGTSIALGENPDRVLYGGRNRLYISGDGGRFWRALGVEFPQIHDVDWGPAEI